MAAPQKHRQQQTIITRVLSNRETIRTIEQARDEASHADDEPEIGWSDYSHIAAGEYQAYCRAAKIYFDARYKRWTCLLRFDLLSDDCQRVLAERIPYWLSLGYGKKPHASRKGSYFTAWLDANGGHRPPQNDRFSPRIFTRRVCRVRVGDTSGKAPYSVVREILRWETGER